MNNERDIFTCNFDYVNNNIYVFGGLSSVNGNQNSIEYYSIDYNKWYELSITYDIRYYQSSYFINSMDYGH